MKLKHLLGAAALAVVLAGPALAEDISIAVVGPMTGQLANIGDQFKQGAQAAAAAINEKGGVGGRKINIVIEDDVCDPKQAVSVANRIVADGIHFVDGHACSGSSIPASAVYAESGVLMMSPASSNPRIDRSGGQEGLAEHHAALYPRRCAGRVHRPVDRGKVQGKEHRHSARQERLRAGRRRMPSRRR